MSLLQTQFYLAFFWHFVNPLISVGRLFARWPESERGAGCSLFARSSPTVDTENWAKKMQPNINNPISFIGSGPVSVSMGFTKWQIKHFWKRTLRVVSRTGLWMPVASHSEACRGESHWAKYPRKDQWSKFRCQPLYFIQIYWPIRFGLTRLQSA